MVDRVRPPAVAGSFYPASRISLDETVTALLDGAGARADRTPKALIVPHAGYIYSGPIAASAFARIARDAGRYERVVVLGPAHRKVVRGLASPGASRMATPLGEIGVDVDALAAAGAEPDPAAHAREHCLEVMLPFLQVLAPRARVVPMLVSEAAARAARAARRSPAGSAIRSATSEPAGCAS